MENPASHPKLPGADDKSPALLEALFDFSPDAIIIYDLAGKITGWNAGAEKLYGWSSGDVFGQPFKLIAPPDREQEILETLEGIRRGAPVITPSTVCICKDGRRLKIQANASPLRDREGRLFGAVSIHHDLTAINEQEERLRLAVDAADIGTFDYYPQTGKLMCSEKAKQHFGLTSEAKVDYGTLLRSLHAADRECVEQGLQAAWRPESGGHITLEYRTVSLQDGRERWIAASGQTFFTPEGKPERFVGITRDITDKVRAGEALQESELRFRNLANNIPQLAWMADASGSLFWYNQRWYDYTGIVPQEALGWGWQKIMHPDHISRTMELVRSKIENGKAWEDTAPLRGKDGIFHWFLTRTAPIRDAHNRVTCWFGTSTDITEHLETEARLQKALAAAEEGQRTLETLLEYIPEGIALFDALDGKITHASRYGRELLGIPLENLSVKEAMRQLAVYYPDGVTPMSYEDMPVTRAIQHGEIILNSELVQMTAQGNSVVLMCNAGPIRDHSGKIRGGIITWRDITEIRKIQDALRKNEYELRETDRRKNEFLAMLAHELRNPLSPIRNAVHLMRQAAAIDPFMKRQRDVIDRQVTHMARLLDDLLDVSRITRGLITLKQRPLPVLQILTQALETTQPLIASQNHTLNYTPPPPEILVYGDLDRLAQVVGNLLTNAAKYTPRGGKIRLEARLAGKEVVIRVADNGMGIEPDMLAHVFDLFAQAGRSLERSLGGLGIGLTIVNNMVRMHGGTVEARSEGPGKGSEFLVRIPAISGEFHPANETVETGTGRPEARYRILVVEDIKDTAESLAELLRFWGQEVQVAYDGQEALDKMPIFKPEIVLLDIGLPRIDGYEVARRIRSQFDQHVRIIAMSGYGQAQNQNLAEKAGIEQYWVKPVDIEVLQRYLACPPPKGDKNQA